MAKLSFERVADWFLHSSEKDGSSPYLLRKRVFVFANIIQLVVTILALAIIPLTVADSYPIDRLALLIINMVLSALFLASTPMEKDFERAAFLYITAFLINITIAVCTSGGGVSYMLSWYVVIGVVIGFFLRDTKRSAALLMLEITILVLTGLVLNDFQFADSTSEEYRPLLTMGSLLLAVLFCSSLVVINSSLSGSHERTLADQAHTDPLTGLLNRRGFILHVDEQNPGSLLMIDIDHFKAFNDNYGHDAGDRVLIHLAEKVHAVVRDNDRVVRLGGEEFAIWFHRAAPSKLATVVNRIRAAISEPIEITDNQKNAHTVSVNVSGGLVACKLGEGLDEALGRADKLLYKAKAAGRNQVLSES